MCFSTVSLFARALSLSLSLTQLCSHTDLHNTQRYRGTHVCVCVYIDSHACVYSYTSAHTHTQGDPHVYMCTCLCIRISKKLHVPTHMPLRLRAPAPVTQAPCSPAPPACKRVRGQARPLCTRAAGAGSWRSLAGPKRFKSRYTHK